MSDVTYTKLDAVYDVAAVFGICQFASLLLPTWLVVFPMSTLFDEVFRGPSGPNWVDQTDLSLLFLGACNLIGGSIVFAIFWIEAFRGKA